ncbi:hypothetical protein GIB67_038443 [Kingdonia uniflora]|uniref:Uncharacterized protein n=1 Tax=Kingdonia uniflora TaxID=39325 RepID=A0A7J7NP52_9MAGN|nr:hypothetical protein GIB67_038443 [Kingdonia uniflora]
MFPTSHLFPTSSPPHLFISNHHFDIQCFDLSPIVVPTTNTPILSFRISNQRSRRRRRWRCMIESSTFERKIEASWSPLERVNSKDEYGGWVIAETETSGEEEKKSKLKGLLRFSFVGVGVSVAVVIAAIACKGFGLQFRSPLSSLQRVVMSFQSNVSDVNSVVSEATQDITSGETSAVNTPASVTKLKHTFIPIAVDSTQHEAVQLLKKLKIIEDDVRVDGLCTRREYARWLVKANSLLERNPKHRIIPYILHEGSVVQAFDDVNIEDPDFWEIQGDRHIIIFAFLPFVLVAYLIFCSNPISLSKALAEAGIVLSNLSVKNSKFFSESYLSRLDLVNWKVLLEYPFGPTKISRKKVGYIDLKETGSGASLELFMDMLAGDKSILRRVFGHSKRLQPHRPATKAQAAVALTSGRMAKAIRSEMSRLEVENSARLVEMEEIRIKLLLRGDIQKCWGEKLREVKAHSLEVTRHFNATIHDLEQQKNVFDKILSENMKEKAALDCQRQLLLSLKDEIRYMSERLVSETANAAAEHLSLEDMCTDLAAKQEAITEAKSILEAEKEALQILRSWVEDEARRSQARAKVLEEVGRRWKWEGEA